MSNLLLATKFYIPDAPPNLVTRPRLIEHLRAGCSGKLTLISAPAGFGKTSLAREWVMGLDRPVVWLSLDEEDNDPTRFLDHLIAGLQQVRPSIGQAAKSFLGSPEPPPVQTLITALINDLAAASTPLVLVLDDYHSIREVLIHQGIQSLLDRQPPQMHLVITTREDPPLALARLRARGQITEVRARHLRFTEEETNTFLNQRMGLNLSQGEIATLTTRTEGWIAGLQLAALSLSDQQDRSAFVQGFSGTDRYIMDFLVDEILSRQTPEIQRFLLQTSILDRLSGPLCDALVYGDDPAGQSQDILERLERANLFLVPLDSTREWFRYQDLFAELLRYRLKRLDDQRIPELHRRASVWHEARGHINLAVSHALAGREVERAAALIERQGWSLIERGELATLAGWLNAVEPLTAKRPWLCVYRAWERIFAAQYEAAEISLLGAEQTLTADAHVQNEDQQQLLGHIGAVRTYITIMNLDIPRAIESAHRALDLLPENNTTVRSIVNFYFAVALWLNDDLSKGTQAFVESARIARAAGNLHIAVSALLMLAYSLVVTGKLHRAAEVLLEAIRLTTQPGGQPLPAAAEAFAGMGNLEYEWNHIDTAAKYLNTGAALSRMLSEECGSCGQDATPLNTGAALNRMLGPADTILGSRIALANPPWMHARIQGEAQPPLGSEYAVEEAGFTMTDAALPACQLRVLLDRGEIQAAQRFVERLGLTLDGSGGWIREAEYLMFARLLAAQGEYGTALALLEHRLHAAEAGERWGHTIEILIIQALVFDANGRSAQALAALERALTLAGPEGYIRVFVDEGAPMAQLLYKALLQGISAEYCRRLLAGFPETAFEKRSASEKMQELVEPLSEREVEVLRLIAEGCSNSETAQKLYISLDTVKGHTLHIYGKLGVSSRTQAVAKARAFGILPPE